MKITSKKSLKSTMGKRKEVDAMREKSHEKEMVWYYAILVRPQMKSDLRERLRTLSTVH